MLAEVQRVRQRHSSLLQHEGQRLDFRKTSGGRRNGSRGGRAEVTTVGHLCDPGHVT